VVSRYFCSSVVGLAAQVLFVKPLVDEGLSALQEIARSMHIRMHVRPQRDNSSSSFDQMICSACTFYSIYML